MIYGEKGGSVISARSYGQVNVQVVLEKIGGGGSLTSAGAQFPDKSTDETAVILTQAIEDYLKEIENKEKPE